MPESNDQPIRVEKRKIKKRRHKHSHSSSSSSRRKDRAEGYSSSVHAGRYRSFDKVETSIMAALFKILGLVCLAALILWGLSNVL